MVHNTTAQTNIKSQEVIKILKKILLIFLVLILFFDKKEKGTGTAWLNITLDTLCRSYQGQFYGSDDQTNSVMALKDSS